MSSAIRPNGTRFSCLFFARSVVSSRQRRQSRSIACPTLPPAAARSKDHLDCQLGRPVNVDFRIFKVKPAHSLTISSLVNTRVFGFSFGLRMPTIGEKSMMPRSAAKFHIRTMADWNRLAPIGARFRTLSIKRTASRRVCP